MRTIQVFYQSEGVNEVQLTHAEDGEPLAQVKARLGAKHGIPGDACLFLENGDEPLDEGRTVGSVATKGNLKLHLHRCKTVHVSVAFAGPNAEGDFPPSTTVAHVKKWAAEKKFKMSNDDAGEHVLQLKGTQVRPPPGTHIGTLTKCPDCRVAFDLVPDERVNGSCLAQWERR